MHLRPSKDENFLELAYVVAKRSSCARSSHGCILVDSKDRIIATGYNGPARGMPNCTERTPCGGAFLKSGEGLDKCVAIHAEQNALLQCSDPDKVAVAYITATPCVHCIKMLMNTSCKRIVYGAEYPHTVEAMRLWPWHWAQIDLQLKASEYDVSISKNGPENTP